MSAKMCKQCGVAFKKRSRESYQQWGDRVFCSRECCGRAKLLDFWPNVDKSGACWIWTGSVNHDGYGHFRGEGAHRASYRMMFGRIPEGLEVLHSCDNPPCVNPDHLRAGTHQENMTDCALKRRSWMKVQPRDVVEIRARRAAGERLRVIAQDFGISEANVSLIARGLSRANTG